MDDIKFCPFCGGEAIVNNHITDKKLNVSCTKCYCQTPFRYFDTRKIKIESGAVIRPDYETARAEVIRIWNTRKEFKQWDFQY